MSVLPKEKSPSVLEHQTDHGEFIFNDSIPQTTQAEYLAIEMEVIKRDPIGIDSFIGNIRSFKLYLKARRIFLAIGIIA